MSTKFIRGMIFNSGSSTASASYMLKFMYEFWGYCIYGGASLSSPGIGSFASTTPFGGSLPTNFIEGTSVVASGADGQTIATTVFRYDGYTDFITQSSTPFNSNMVGKQLVIWKAGSNSSEDSIYNIIGYKSSSNIVINVNNGGTPSYNDGYKPAVTSRTSINYRVVDIASAGVASGVADGNYLVFQLDPTGINAGQTTSQIQIVLSGSTRNFTAKISPNGTWNGTAFGSDASGTISPNDLGGGTSFYNGSSSGQTMSINLIGDKDFLITHCKDSSNPHNSGYSMHWEIPERLYTSTQDVNPITLSLNSWINIGSAPVVSTSTTAGYGGGFIMRCNDGIYRNYRTAVRATTGDGNATNSTGAAQIPGNSLTDFRAGANYTTGNLINSSGILCLPGVAGQYSLARVKLKRVRFANSFMPLFTRFSSDGDFILLSQGVAIPWDKTVLPFTLFRF